jgi:hypothetical protein
MRKRDADPALGGYILRATHYALDEVNPERLYFPHS